MTNKYDSMNKFLHNIILGNSSSIITTRPSTANKTLSLREKLTLVTGVDCRCFRPATY
jgi:hypothetical protein